MRIQTEDIRVNRDTTTRILTPSNGTDLSRLRATRTQTKHLKQTTVLTEERIAALERRLAQCETFMEQVKGI